MGGPESNDRRASWRAPCRGETVYAAKGRRICLSARGPSGSLAASRRQPGKRRCAGRRETRQASVKKKQPAEAGCSLCSLGVTRSVAHLNARPVPTVAIPHGAASRPVAGWNVHRGRRGNVIDRRRTRCRNPEQRSRSEPSDEPCREIVACRCRLCRDARQCERNSAAHNRNPLHVALSRIPAEC